MLLVILKAKKLLDCFKKELQKINQKDFIVKTSINYMLNGKGTIVILTVGMIKKDMV